jgi:hypothetical protein
MTFNAIHALLLLSPADCVRHFRLLCNDAAELLCVCARSSWVVGTTTVTEKGLVVIDPSCLVPLMNTFVMPIGKNDPEGGSLVTTPQLPANDGA